MINMNVYHECVTDLESEYRKVLDENPYKVENRFRDTEMYHILRSKKWLKLELVSHQVLQEECM